MRKLVRFSMMIALSVLLWAFGSAEGKAMFDRSGATGAMLASLSDAATQQTVSGVVTGPEGEPLPGVSVTVVGSQAATGTDESGNFSISAAMGSTLRFTMIGFASKDVEVTSS